MSAHYLLYDRFLDDCEDGREILGPFDSREQAVAYRRCFVEIVDSLSDHEYVFLAHLENLDPPNEAINPFQFLRQDLSGDRIRWVEERPWSDDAHKNFHLNRFRERQQCAMAIYQQLLDLGIQPPADIELPTP